MLGGLTDETMINNIDIDDRGNIAAGGYTKDNGLLGRSYSQKLPLAFYLAKGNYYLWGKQIETNDGFSTGIYETVLDVVFRTDGEKIALSLERGGP